MLTVTETITRELTLTEELNLDNNDVVENYLKAMNAKDKKLATQYARIMMMKALCMKD